MRHRTVSELMTKDVARVRRDTPFKDIVKLLAEYDVTAVPVVDDEDRPVGVVSEDDLLRKATEQPDPLGHLEPLRPEAWEHAKAEGTTAEELMSAPAMCARPEWSVVEAARLMEAQHVKRLPVVDEADRLRGIVSRSDLLRVFLRRDLAIREEILGDVLVKTLRLTPTDVNVTVVDGLVTLDGTVERASLARIAERLCRGVDGVVSVTNHLRSRIEDTSGNGA